MRKAVDDYFAEGTASSDARSALAGWGDAALPFLRELAGQPGDVGVLESFMPVRFGDWNLVCAIDEVGTPEAIELQIEVLDGKTSIEPSQALMQLGTATWQHGNQLRDHKRFQQLVFKFAKEDKGILTSLARRQAAEIIAELDWEEGEPLLELMLQSEDLDLREAAAEAIEKLTGRHVDVKRPASTFPAEELTEVLVPVRVASRGTLGGRLEMWFDGRPALLDGRGRNLTAADAAGETLASSALSMEAMDILSLPLSPRGHVWMVIGHKPGSGSNSVPDFAACLDHDGRELWRFEPQDGSFEAMCRLYAADRCVGIALGPGGDEGVVAFSPEGDRLFQVPNTYVTYELSSHPRVADRWLHCGGDLQVFDNSGRPVAGGRRLLDMRKGGGHLYASHAVLAAAADGSAKVVAAGSGPRSMPRVVGFDEGLRAEWFANLSSDISGLVLLDRGDRPPLCAAVTEVGELVVFNLAGRLQQRLQLADAMPGKVPDKFWVYSISSGWLDEDRYGLAIGLLTGTMVYELR